MLNTGNVESQVFTDKTQDVRGTLGTVGSTKLRGPVKIDHMENGPSERRVKCV